MESSKVATNSSTVRIASRTSSSRTLIYTSCQRSNDSTRTLSIRYCAAMNRRTFLALSAGAALSAVLPATASAAGARASLILESAGEYLGVPYIYGGNDPNRGLDCSAYLSLIWGIPRQSTDTIHNWSTRISKAQLMPGDGLNLPFVGRRSHCRVFAGWATEDRKVAWMYEAARQRGVNYRVVAYDDEYTPIRRVGFIADVAPPPLELPLDYDVANGHFYSQIAANDGLTGFSVLNKDGVQLWNEFRRLGGVKVLGYPISRRFDWRDRANQEFQRGVLRWVPEDKSAVFLTAEIFHTSGAVTRDALEPHPSPFVEPKT